LTRFSSCAKLAEKPSAIGGSAMLRAENKGFLTESGSGTGMGELPHGFGFPILPSEELLVFRDEWGAVGVAPLRNKSNDYLIDRSGGRAAHQAKDLPAGMLERFGDLAGFVGWPRIAAAE
jgi:hypothetical protein